MAYPNPYSWTQSDLASVSCVSNAAYCQQVIVTARGARGSLGGGTFQGQGEGTAMALPDGQTTLDFATRGSITITAQFQYSTSGMGGPWQNANVVTINDDNGTLTIGTEDASDGDANDTVLTSTT